MHVAPAASVVSSRDVPTHASPARRQPRAEQVERRAGRLLRIIRDLGLLDTLGFVRLGDYVVERLGVSYRTAQEWMRVDEVLESAPLVAAALESGEITSAHVRLLTRVVTPENEAARVELARKVGVRELGRAVAAWREEREASGCDGGPQAGAGGAVEPEGAGGRGSPEVAGSVPREDGIGCGRRLGEYEDEADAPPESERIELEAPAWLAHTWRDTIAFARQLAGAPLSRGACLEMVLAEFGGSAGVAAPAGESSPPGSGLGGRPCPAVADLPSSAHPASREGGGPDGSSLKAVPGKSNGGDLRSSAPGTGDASLSCRQARDSEAASLRAHAIDGELLDLMAARQRHDWSLAERLRAVAASRTYQLDGFTSLEAYVRERLALPARRVYLLLALHRMLERLPGVRASFLAGRLTLKKAMIVGSVATVATELAWIGRARSVTLRRLEDEVCFWKHIREVRPSVWELLDGGPLPEGIVLVPGRPARLSSSAPNDGSGDTDLRSSARAEISGDTRMHSSAPVNDLGETGLHSSARADGSGETDLPPSARRRGAVLTTQAFLRALENDEGAVPLPAHRVAIRLRVEPGVREMWESALARCRATIGEAIAGWEVLALALDAFWKTWDNKLTRRQRREHPTIERDGWRCMVPGCRSMGTGKLHEHHIRFRSQGGALTDPENLVTLCTAHHERLLHEGFIRCSGRAPDDLTWELGVERGREAFLVYRGEERVGGCAA